MENQKRITDPRVFKNDENGFEVRFKPQKLGAYIALSFAAGLFIINKMLFGWHIVINFNGFEGLIYTFGSIFLKIGLIYTIYLAVYTFMSDYIIKLDNENLSKYSAPIPRLRGNKTVLRYSIESYKVEKSTTTARASQASYTRMTQTYYNLRVKLKNEKEFTFFFSLSQDETHLIKKLLDEHLNLQKS